MSLISADAWRLAITFSQGPYVYDVFLSIIVALDPSAPFNSLIGSRANALHRAEATMRDPDESGQ
ncbi:hypothetical protein RhiJN_19622 [Ceratobasidium sp. AG-Ba]|nr:hypothetical protein RhiJN_19622 [Ceratobasidium sp. AG-Ba]